MDLVVESLVIVEIKAVERIIPVHEAQPTLLSQIDGQASWLVDKFSRSRSEKRA